MVKKETRWLYLEPLLNSQEFIHLAEISKRLDKNHSVVRKYLKYFEEQGILNKKIKGRLATYKFNPLHPLIVDYVSIVEKEKVINKCRKDLIINEVVTFLHNNLNEDNKALIFGSSITDARKAKDIDLLITGKLYFGKGLESFEKKFNVKIHLINVKNLKSVNKGLREEITAKHLIVQ